jgi:primosomal protein N' (replication factor Y)
VSGPLVSVAVPVSVDRGFTYRVPDDWPEPPRPGERVLVPFGPRALVGVVRPVPPDPPPATEKVRALLARLDPDGPSLPPDLVSLCEWMADYYIAPIGEVYRAALPGLSTNADARVAFVTADGEAARHAIGALLSAAGADLDDLDRRLLDTIASAGPSGHPVAALTSVRPKIPAVLLRLDALVGRGLARVDFTDAEAGDARTETHVRRTDYLRGSGTDEDALARSLGRSKQRRALLDLLEAQRRVADDPDDGWVAIGDLRGPFPRVRELLEPLVDQELVAQIERPRRMDPFDTGTHAPNEPQTPTADQAEALSALYEDVDAGEFRSALLHGITGSGKTEVYLQLIAHVRRTGRGAIVLVPEIALTPQLSDRFRARFGDEVAVLHSGLTPRQRLDAWLRIRAGELPIVIGARSAIFAPLPALGVIVVDEEHDPSFKQEEGVRYHARDLALVRAREQGVVVVLGSATPSLETYFRARDGKHRFLQLRQRPTPRPLPKVEVVSLAVHKADPESLLTGRLRAAIGEVVEAGEQAIVFLNRRGFTTNLVCVACGHLQSCPDCSAPSMTYHLGRNRLLCHLCGHIESAPRSCRACGAPDLVHGGVGTERVELAIEKALPGVRVLRLDRDAARGRELLRTLAKFRAHEADVLVGTQMLSKGHDFPGVTLVGILQGDHGLALPDPRAAERTFQLLTQVAGRAGRGDRPGRVIVQAWAIEHPAIVHAAEHDFSGFAEEELEARRSLHNPPFGHLALVRVHGLDAAAVRARAEALGQRLRAAATAALRGEGEDERGRAPVDVLGPVASPIERINRRTRWQILLRAARRPPLRWVLGRLRPLLGAEGHGARKTLALADVDPQSLL